MEQQRKVLQFKITMDGSRPLVWRRIIVPGNYTFFDLHCAIQDSMGWYDGHLHSFYISADQNRERISIEFPDPEREDFHNRHEVRDERAEYLRDYFGKVIKQCVYNYDFGDNWDHIVLFEKELDAVPGQKYPQCTAGKNACPPEDCGGIGGYEHLREILKNPDNDEYQDMLDWLGLEDGLDFDPTAFNADEVHFSNPKLRLKQYEKGFGVAPLRFN